MALTDTSEAARRRQIDVYASTPGADKVILATEMAERARQIAIEGIRTRNPEFSEREIHISWLEMLHGDLAPLLATHNTTEAS